MTRIREKTAELLDAIRESDEFIRYEAAKRRIEGCTQEKQTVDAFRLKAYQVSNMTKPEDMESEMKALAVERARVRKDPVVANYLSSEMELCRLLQEVCGEVLSVTDLQIDDFIDYIEV